MDMSRGETTTTTTQTCPRCGVVGGWAFAFFKGASKWNGSVGDIDTHTHSDSDSDSDKDGDDYKTVCW